MFLISLKFTFLRIVLVLIFLIEWIGSIVLYALIINSITLYLHILYLCQLISNIPSLKHHGLFSYASAFFYPQFLMNWHDILFTLVYVVSIEASLWDHLSDRALHCKHVLFPCNGLQMGKSECSLSIVSDVPFLPCSCGSK